jgi:hypothetical protein
VEKHQVRREVTRRRGREAGCKERGRPAVVGRLVEVRRKVLDRMPC